MITLSKNFYPVLIILLFLTGVKNPGHCQPADMKKVAAEMEDLLLKNMMPVW